MSTITVERIGRRSYLRGNTYPLREQLRSAGAHWDADQRAWWIGSDETARQLAERAGSAAPSGAQPGARSSKSPGPEAVVAGKATYKGRTYYVAGRVERGRTHYDDRVRAVTSRDGSRVLLYSRDGALEFWAPLWSPTYGQVVRVSEIGARRAPADMAEITKTYDRPQTIGRLQRYAEEAQQARAQGHEDGIPEGRTYECEECGERVVRGQGSCWETGHAH